MEGGNIRFGLCLVQRLRIWEFPKLGGTLGLLYKGYYKGTVRIPLKGSIRDVNGLCLVHRLRIGFWGLGFRVVGFRGLGQFGGIL